MPVLTGHLSQYGAAVVLVEVAAPLTFSRSIRSRGLTAAAPVRVQAVIDTGSFVTASTLGSFWP